MSQVTIERRIGRVDRVPPDKEPTVKLDLEPGQVVVGFEMRTSLAVTVDRKTNDWYWTAYILTPAPSR
jgi:hypothetical protein